MELRDQVEGVVAAQAREVEVLREDERGEHGERPRDARRHGQVHGVRCRGRGGRGGALRLVPPPDPPQDDNRRDGERRAPRDARLAARDDEKGRQQRAERRSEVAAYLEERLREAVAAARRHARDARRLGMKDRRADAHQARCHEECGKRRRRREHQHAGERERHAADERVRHRPPIGVEADHRLQERCGQLQRQRHQADLREREREGRLEHRIQRRDERLQRVVQQMREARAGKNGEGRRTATEAIRGGHVRRAERRGGDATIVCRSSPDRCASRLRFRASRAP